MFLSAPHAHGSRALAIPCTHQALRHCNVFCSLYEEEDQGLTWLSETSSKGWQIQGISVMLVPFHSMS